MERKIIDRTIKKSAEGIRAPLRAEFTQDMWVALLGKGDNLDKDNINLVAFRERENWLAARKFCGRNRPPVDPDTFDLVGEVTPEDAASGKEILGLKVEALLDSLRSNPNYSQADADRVVEGLPWNAIAESIGRSPAAFDYHVNKARKAAA